MNIGDKVIVPDGQIGVLTGLENGIGTVLFQLPTHIIESAFNEADLKPAP